MTDTEKQILVKLTSIVTMQQTVMLMFFKQRLSAQQLLSYMDCINDQIVQLHAILRKVIADDTGDKSRWSGSWVSTENDER